MNTAKCPKCKKVWALNGQYCLVSHPDLKDPSQICPAAGLTVQEAERLQEGQIKFRYVPPAYPRGFS